MLNIMVRHNYDLTAFPQTDEIFSWIESLCQFPHRRTGTTEGFLAAGYLKQQFSEIGLMDVKIEETPSAVYTAEDYSLEVAGKEIPCFMINGTLHPEEYGVFDAGPDCMDTEILYLGEGREKDFEGVDVKGKIVLCECPWFESNEESYAANWCREGAIIYDPDKDNREVLRKTDSYSPNAWPYNYLTAQKKGAAGFVGVLTDYFEDGINWNEDYSEIAYSQGCRAFELPGIWIGITAFHQVKTLLTDRKATATLRLKTRYERGAARNVTGILPGATEEYILIHSHYDAVFTGAVQDASGTSEVLALAKYFAQVPEEQRKKSLIFACFDGHYTDYAGHQAFIKSRLEQQVNITHDIVIEHIGKEVGLGEGNRPVISETPEMRFIYVTDVDHCVDMVEQLVKKNDIRRTLIIPVKPYEEKENEVYEFQQDEVISDAYYTHIHGVPIISMLSPQLYLFHPMDKPDMIPKEELRPVGMFFAEIIHDLFHD